MKTIQKQRHQPRRDDEPDDGPPFLPAWVETVRRMPTDCVRVLRAKPAAS